MTSISYKSVFGDSLKELHSDAKICHWMQAEGELIELKYKLFF